MRDEYELRLSDLDELHKKNFDSLTHENDTLKHLLEDWLSQAKLKGRESENIWKLLIDEISWVEKSHNLSELNLKKKNE